MINTPRTIILLSYICIASVSAAIITPALPAISAHFNLSKGLLEWVISIFLLGYVFGELIYGPLANRFGRLKALRIGLLINFIGIVICLISFTLNSFVLLLTGRFIEALGAASGLVCTFILVTELFSEDRAKFILSFTVVSFTVGIGLAVLIGGLTTNYLRWQDCFWILLIHCVVMFILTWQFPETLKKPQSLRPLQLLKNYRVVLRNSDLIIFSLLAGTACIFTYCYAAAAPIYIQNYLKLSPSAYGYWNILNMVGMFCGGYFCAKLLLRFESKTILVGALFFQIPCFISLILLLFSRSPTALWFFLTTTALFFFTSLVFSTATFFASTAVTDKANGSSMMSFLMMAVAAFSVIIFGYLPFSSLGSFILILIGSYLVVLMISAKRLLSFFFLKGLAVQQFANSKSINR